MLSLGLAWQLGAQSLSHLAPALLFVENLNWACGFNVLMIARISS